MHGNKPSGSYSICAPPALGENFVVRTYPPRFCRAEVTDLLASFAYPRGCTTTSGMPAHVGDLISIPVGPPSFLNRSILAARF